MGSTPGTERRPPVRVSSPIARVSASESCWEVAAGCQHRERDRQVEVGATLEQVGRGQQDRHPLAGGPRKAGVGDRHPYAVARLLEGGVGPTDQAGAGHPGRHVGLDVDQVAERAVEGDGVGGRERHQHSPRTWSTSDGPRLGRTTATRSSLTSAGWTSCSWIQAAASRRSRASLAGVIASCGLPQIDERARLHLADDEHVTVAQDQVDLTGHAAPVAVEHDQALLDEVPRSEALAVCAEGLVSCGGRRGWCGHAATVARATDATRTGRCALWTGPVGPQDVEGTRPHGSLPGLDQGLRCRLGLGKIPIEARQRIAGFASEALPDVLLSLTHSGGNCARDTG